MNDEVYKIVTSSEKLTRIGYEMISDGYAESYHLNGLLHREGDNPAYIDITGLKKWYIQGKLHRFLGPSVVPPLSADYEEVYCLGAVVIHGKDREDFKKLLGSPLELAPLYINHEVLKEVAKYILEGKDNE